MAYVPCSTGRTHLLLTRPADDLMAFKINRRIHTAIPVLLPWRAMTQRWSLWCFQSLSNASWISLIPAKLLTALLKDVHLSNNFVSSA